MFDAFAPKLVKVVFSRYIAFTIKGEFGEACDCLVGNIG
jgi:hypothetical protein